MLTEPAELALAKKLMQFGEVVPQILDDYRPNLLANYLYELATIYHSFYEQCPVLKSEGATDCDVSDCSRLAAAGIQDNSRSK